MRKTAAKKKVVGVRKHPAVSAKKVLPSKVKVPETDMMQYLWLLYGREKIGKTTFFSQFPGALFLATEPGTKGLSIYEVAVTDWGIIRQVRQELSTTDRFELVVFDTVDRAYDMCLDYVCKKKGIEYPGEDVTGQQDFGRSWRAVKQEFMHEIHGIIQTGRGVAFTSHVSEMEFKSGLGKKYTKIFPSMSTQARKVIEALVDFFLYADYFSDSEGTTHRVLITEGDETIWAGSRSVDGITLPRMLPMHPTQGYEILRDAFHGDHPGLDPSTLRVEDKTSKTASSFLPKYRRESEGGVAKRKAPKRK